MEKQVLIFGKKCINQNTVHRNKRSISINQVETRRTV